MTQFKTIIFFVLFSIIYISAIITDNYLVANLSKALPVMLLIIAMVLNANPEKSLLFGFMFSAIGDVLLLPALDLFEYGLTAFLIAHLFYIFTFYKRKPKLNFNFAIIYYALGIYIFYILNEKLGDLYIPVAIYIFVIITMAWFAKNQSRKSPSYIYAYIGALFFVISDTILALNKFVGEISFGSIIVISTYWIAQYLIFKSSQDLISN